MYFYCSEFLDLSVEVGLINQTRTAACQDCPEVLRLCSQLSKEDKHERRGKKNPKQTQYQRGVAADDLTATAAF